jgi:hypothetical protein
LRWAIAALLVLGGCSSSAKPPPEDATLARSTHAGQIAFGLEQPDQAATQYRSALERARTRDDAAAIADAGFNLATAQMRAGQPSDALKTARELQAELARRGITDSGFDLIAATAQFQLNDLRSADRVAAGLTGSGKPELANPAWFLRGLIADAHHDRPALAKAAASLTQTADPGDIAELQARLTRQPAPALQAADLRRERLDYRGMARALALAADFTSDATKAADLYLRAGRSAAAQGDTGNARRWLEKAHKLSSDTDLQQLADQALRQLPPASASRPSAEPAPAPTPPRRQHHHNKPPSTPQSKAREHKPAPSNKQT